MISFPVDKKLPVEYAKAKAEEEKVVDLNTFPEETIVNIYPNPTSGILKVEVTNLSNENNVDLSLYDLNGSKLIDQKKLPAITDLDISKYKDGMYILQIKYNGAYHNYKIVKKN